MGKTAVEIDLKSSDHEAVFTVRDFGHGMPAGLMQGSQTNGDTLGVGLTGMRERVNDLGGKFEIESDGKGTAIIVTIPLGAERSQARPSTVEKSPSHSKFPRKGF